MPRTYFCLYLLETKINTSVKNIEDHKVINYAKHKPYHQRNMAPGMFT